ncbi:MAG: hypothetical protein M1821_003959 [Bathelium mastoideum]|nr:MAG: hypothetical protein M1821_003959 [Bathelium mastoideum]
MPSLMEQAETEMSLVECGGGTISERFRPAVHSGAKSRRTKDRLQGHPDSEFIVFHGNEHEAGEVELSGKVLLNAPESLSFKSIKIVLEGKRKISWPLNTVTGSETSEKKTFYYEEKVLTLDSCTTGAHKLHRGQHAFPFKFSLNGALPESVEGMNNAWIVYTLRARMERGYLAKDLTASQHIRIIRTMGQDELEMVQSRTNSDIWSNKISYNISLPSDAYIFGTTVTADVELTPIRKGLGMGKIELQLVEKSTLKIFSTELVAPGQVPLHVTVTEKEVAKVNIEFPEESRIEIPNPDPDTLMDEMYKFPLHLQLPRSLRDCRQNVNHDRIKIDHVWRLKVNLHNPEGHISQLICKIPLKLFISPNLPINDNQDVCPGPDHVADAVINQQETTLVAPPEYGAHHLDQLYNDIDPSGFRTPHVAGMSLSGTATPYAHSRTGSSENLASLAQAMDDSTNEANDENGGGVSASAIHSRLSHLQDQRSRSWPPHPTLSSHSQTSATLAPGNDYFHYSNGRSSRPTPPSSRPLSRRISDEHSSPDPDDPAVKVLSRVPSYNTAVQTPRPENPVDSSLPTYEVATSRPPTPELQRPGQAHVRNGHGSGSLLQNMTLVDDNSEAHSAMSTTIEARHSSSIAPAHHRRGTDGDDEEARLRFLRANLN